MKKPFVLPTAVCLSVVIAGWAVAAEPAKIPRLGYKAPDFTLNTLDQQPVTLSNLTKDSSVVLVVLRGYPGYQCPICMIQVGDLKKHEQEIADANTKVVLVYPGPAENLGDRAAEFIKGRSLGEHFLFVTDPDYTFTNAYGLRWDAPKETAYPSTFVIDRQGTVRFVKTSKSHGDRAKTGEVLKVLPGKKSPSAGG